MNNACITHTKDSNLAESTNRVAQCTQRLTVVLLVLISYHSRLSLFSVPIVTYGVHVYDESRTLTIAYPSKFLVENILQRTADCYGLQVDKISSDSVSHVAIGALAKQRSCQGQLTTPRASCHVNFVRRTVD